jgi:MFS family permease
MLMATINQSIVLIALPDIFRGIGLNPLSPGNTSYLLWMFMGFLVVSAVLVVSFGRLGDMFGRVRMYTLGFAIFSVASIFLTVTWMHGADGAMWLIIWRVVQGIGGAFLFANAAAIVTDAFPANAHAREGSRAAAVSLSWPETRFWHDCIHGTWQMISSSISPYPVHPAKVHFHSGLRGAPVRRSDRPDY